MDSVEKELNKGKRNRDDHDHDNDTVEKKTKIITEYDVYNSDEAYELLRENDDIKIDDIIHVIPNNQEGYEKYIVVKNSTTGEKDLKEIDNYYKIQQRAYEEDNQQGGKKNKSKKQRKSTKRGKTRKSKKERKTRKNRK
jgi:hypothetical protein